MDEIIEHQDKYIGLPLCADTVNLVSGRYSKLGHCYNPKTGTYSSSIIGSFYRFEKEELENGEVALVGYARVMKRNKRVCKAIGELFAEGALKFSFEISCGTYETLDDDTILIDAAENNFIEGMCIVSFPACPEAVALELVAEINGIRKEADDMIDAIESAEVVAEVEAHEPEAADTTEIPADTGEPEAVVAEVAEDPAEPEDVVAEVEPVEAPAEESIMVESEAQNAEVHVSTNTFTCETTEVYDDQTGTSVIESTTHEIRTHERVPEATLEIQVGEEMVAQEEISEPAPVIEASAQNDTSSDMIAELQRAIETLRQEIADMRAERIVAEAEKPDASAEINPFIAEIAAPKKYSLLESDKPSGNGNAYSLLEKA